MSITQSNPRAGQRSFDNALSAKQCREQAIPECEIIVEQCGEEAEAAEHNTLACAIVKSDSQRLCTGIPISQVQPEVSPAARLQHPSGCVGKG